MIKGIPFDFGNERTLIIAPLTLGTMETMQERIEKLQAGDDPNGIATVIDLAHASLKRNYPSLSREDVAELVDVGNMGRLVDAAMDVSGNKRAALDATASVSVDPQQPLPNAEVTHG